MSYNDKVVWSEGMFLRPQHYQQYTRYFENYLEERSAVLRSHAWGVNALQLDENLLKLGKLSVTKAVGIFSDGTPFRMPVDHEPPLALEVPDNVKNEIVYLCIPLRRSGISNLELSGDVESLARYQPGEEEIFDDSTMGGGTATIQTGKLRTRLMFEHQHRDEYACIGICRVIERKADNSLLIDDTYIAAALSCAAAPPLIGFIRELSGLLSHRADALMGRVVASGRGGAADIADFLLLQAVNRYLPLIRYFTEASLLHPEEFYKTAVCMAGEMATFTANDKKSPVFEAYRHDALHETYKPVIDALRQSLSMVLEQTAMSLPLQERKYGIRVSTVSDAKLFDEATFVLAVTSDMSSEDLRKRFPALVKIGPVEQIRQLVNAQLPGIRVRPIPVAPRQIPYHTGFVYFELERGGELWAQLAGSGGFAFHVGGDFPGLQIEFWAIRG